MKLTTNLTWLAAAAMVAGAPLAAQDMKSVAISTIVEVPALTDTKDGILKALAERGFVDGETITVDYQNANGNMPTQQQIAKKFVGDRPDVIIPITTPTSQAVAAATSDIPIVFATVTDPIKASLIQQYEKPGGNITGVSDAAPVPAQVEMLIEIIPDLKKLGFIYNPGLDNSLSSLETLKEVAAEHDIEIIESAAPTTNEVTLATKKLIGEVDAVYIPNDTTIVAALEAIIKIGQDVDMPIFTGETGGVTRGAIAAVGLDYVAVGEIVGQIAADVLEGAAPGDIDAVIAYEAVEQMKVVVNLGAAERMGVTIPDSVLSRATETIE